VKNKGLVGLVIIGLVMAITWALGSAIMVQALHGKDAFTVWRQHHFWLYVMVWLAAVIVITIPILYVVGTRMAKAMGESEQALAASKGVGRLAMQALQGRESAIDKLVLLLKDPNPMVRYQSVRALAFLDDEDVNPTLFKIIRYWPGNEKLALIDTLRRTQDVRTGKLLTELTNDRSPQVSRRAMSALPIVMGRTWRGPTQAEDEVRRAKGRGNRAAGLTGVPQVFADLPAHADSKKEDRPLITRSAPRTEPAAVSAAKHVPKRAAKPAANPAAKAAAKPVAQSATDGGTMSAAKDVPAKEKTVRPKRSAPKPAVEASEVQPAVEPASPPA
jgi:hypothetical protein